MATTTTTTTTISEPSNPDSFEHCRISTNGVTLHVVTAGPKDGPLVILLHGFPETWLAWRKQISALAARGFRVLAPDQRGYAESDKPKGVRAYHVDALVADIAGLIDAEGRAKAHIVGHDWGGIVAWWMATHRPERVDKLVVMNVPHPAVMIRHLFTRWAQAKRSWYIFFFQLPYLSESAAFSKSDGARMAAVLRKTSRPGAFSEEELSAYREAWRQPGAVTAMLNWYRASVALLATLKQKDALRVRVPALLIWGVKDTALGVEMAEPSIALCDDGRLSRFEEATHWVHHDEPKRVSQRLLEFLAK